MTSRPTPFPERIRVERVGADLLVLDPVQGRLHRILPHDARAITEGIEPEHYLRLLGPDAYEAVIRALHEQRWDRRRVLTSAAAAAAAGITTTLLPSAVLALSVGGVSYGSSAENGSFILDPVTIGSSGLSSASSSGSLTGGGVARWEVPEGVTLVEVLAIGTDGGPGPGREGRVGSGGSAAAVGGRFPVSAGDWLHINFTAGASRSNGGPAGSAAAVGWHRTSDGANAWLVVAGGGGGGGRDGSSDPGADYVGGDGGDAGTGAAAGSGQAGQYIGGGSAALALGGGGGGGTLSTVGLGAGSNGNSLDGQDGGTPLTGDMYFTSSTYVRLGAGGSAGNNTYGGGNGAAGLYGGGGGEGVASTGVTGGGGGGSSYLNTAALDSSSPGSTIGPYARAYEQGPYLAIHY